MNKIHIVFKVFGIILVIFIIAIIVFFVFFSYAIGVKQNKNSIIKKFTVNAELFNNSVEELKEETIYFQRENNGTIRGGDILISIHKTLDNGKTKVIDVEKKDNNIYQETIKLMDKLKIEVISKSRGNISYQFNSSMRWGQCIVLLNSEKEYVNSGFEITYKKHIIDKWYYVEEK